MTKEQSGSQEASRRWSMIARVPNVQEAELLAGLLRSQGIECQLESRFFSQEPVALGTLGDVKLWVPQDQLEAAEKLVEDVRNSSMADTESDGEWPDAR